MQVGGHVVVVGESETGEPSGAPCDRAFQPLYGLLHQIDLCRMGSRRRPDAFSRRHADLEIAAPSC